MLEGSDLIHNRRGYIFRPAEEEKRAVRVALNQREQLQWVPVSQEDPTINSKLLPLSDGEVILGKVCGVLGIVYLKEHGPGNMEAQSVFIRANALGPPGAAVVAQVHAEFYQVLCLDVVDGILNQCIVRTFLMLQHGAGRLKKTALKSAFRKMQCHIH